MRSSITPHEKLNATLLYLPIGRCYQSLRFPTVISTSCSYNNSSFCSTIPENCRDLRAVLKNFIKGSTSFRYQVRNLFIKINLVYYTRLRVCMFCDNLYLAYSMSMSTDYFDKFQWNRSQIHEWTPRVRS